MSFLKNLLSCCQAAPRKSDVLLSHLPTTSTIATKVTKTNRKSTVSINSNNYKFLLLSPNNSSTIISFNQSFINMPDYIPVNEVEVSTHSKKGAKRLQITDVKGKLFYGMVVDITCRGIERMKRKSISCDNFQVEMIKTINYFWLRQQGSSNCLRFDYGEQKDYILNYSCEFLSNLSTSYLFLICYIKENNVYKIKFNDSVKNSLSNDETICFKMSSHYWSILPKFCTLFVGEHKLEIIIKENFAIKIMYNKKVYLYKKEEFSSIAIGKGKSNTFSINDDSLDDVSAVIEYRKDIEMWMIRDGKEEKESKKGTWLFTVCPIEIYDGMIVRFLNFDFRINIK